VILIEKFEGDIKKNYIINREDISYVLEKLSMAVKDAPPLLNLKETLDSIVSSYNGSNFGHLLKFIVNQIFFFYAVDKESVANRLFKYLRIIGIDVDDEVFRLVRKKFSYLFAPIDSMKITMPEPVRKLLIDFAAKTHIVKLEAIGFLTYMLDGVEKGFLIKDFIPVTIRYPSSNHINIKRNINELHLASKRYNKRSLILLHTHPTGNIMPSDLDIWNGLMKYMLPIAILATKNSKVYLTLVFFKHRRTVKVGSINT